MSNFNAEKFLEENSKPWSTGGVLTTCCACDMKNASEAVFNASEPMVPEELLAYIQHLEAENRRLVQREDELVTQKNGAYRERNKLVSALSKLFPAWLAQHPENDESWDLDWRSIVFIQLPTGQASWHIHGSEIEQFAHLPAGPNDWDGHTTEEKYERVGQMQNDKAGEVGGLVLRLPELKRPWSEIDEEIAFVSMNVDIQEEKLTWGVEHLDWTGEEIEALNKRPETALEALRTAFKRSGK